MHVYAHARVNTRNMEGSAIIAKITGRHWFNSSLHTARIVETPFEECQNKYVENNVPHSDNNSKEKATKRRLFNGVHPKIYTLLSFSGM